jgi:hypothetical protein
MPQPTSLPRATPFHRQPAIFVQFLKENPFQMSSCVFVHRYGKSFSWIIITVAVAGCWTYCTHMTNQWTYGVLQRKRYCYGSLGQDPTW